MGVKGYAAKSRKIDSRDRSKKRSQRSEAERSQRLDDDKTQRRLKKVYVHKALPAQDEETLLTQQIGQACRLLVPSKDLCALIRSYSGTADEEDDNNTTRKRGRGTENVKALEKLVENLLKLRVIAANEEEDELSDSDDDVLTVFLDIMKNEYGHRVLSALLTALKTVESKKFNDLAVALLEEFEENEDLSKHHNACRLLSVLSFHGSAPLQQRVLSIFQHQVSSEEDLLALLKDNHTSGTISNLLKNGNAETGEWLRETLALSKAHNKKEEDVASRIFSLIEDPVSSRVIRQLIDSQTRAIFFKYLDINALMNSKRGSAFLRDLFTFENESGNESEVAKLTSTLLERIGSSLRQLSADKRANFVVQKVITLTLHAGSKGSDLFQTILRLLGDSVPNLCSNRVGVHVICTLTSTAFSFPTPVIESTASAVLNHNNVADLLFCQTGSLAVRSLMPIVKLANSKTGIVLKTSIERNLDALIFHPVGNLVAQKYFAEVGQGVASVFAKKIAGDQKNFLRMCQDSYASHVVYSILDVVDSGAHTLLCSILRKNAKALSTHINGRFLIEKIIPASAELRNELLREFIPLAMEKGTQHILCSLVSVLDKGSVDSLTSKLTKNLKALCFHQSGSVTVQKLMQANPVVKRAVTEALRSSQSLKRELEQNYFGKFVVQNADN